MKENDIEKNEFERGVAAAVTAAVIAMGFAFVCGGMLGMLLEIYLRGVHSGC